MDKTVGTSVAQIMKGFGCRILKYDPASSILYEEHGAHWVELPELLRQADIIMLHCPLTPEMHHFIDDRDLAQLINTSRGGIIDTAATIQCLKSGKIGYLGLDIYGEEADIFFEKFSDKGIQDDVFALLMIFSDVLFSGHQAFFTRETITNIAHSTLANISNAKKGIGCSNWVMTLVSS